MATYQLRGSLRERFNLLLSHLKTIKKEQVDGKWVELKPPIFVNRLTDCNTEIVWHLGGGRFVHITNPQTSTDGVTVSFRNLRKDSKKRIYLARNIYEYWIRQ